MTVPNTWRINLNPLKRLLFAALLIVVGLDLPGATRYSATVVVKGKVFTTAGDKLIEFDPQAMLVVKTILLPGLQTEISLGQDRHGRLVGLTTKGVYVFDPEKGELVHTATAPVPVNCGFALVDGAVYFGSKAELWRYSLPASSVTK